MHEKGKTVHALTTTIYTFNRFSIFSNPMLSKYFTTGISPAWLVNPCAVDDILTERVRLRTRDEDFDVFIKTMRL